MTFLTSACPRNCYSTGEMLLFVPAGAFKLGLYLYRKAGPGQPSAPRRQVILRWTISALRLGCGFLLPLLAIGLTNPQNVVEWRGLALAGIVLGERIDRGEFYGQIDIQTPGRQILQDLESRWSLMQSRRSPDAP